jgi:hypothetical protein
MAAGAATDDKARCVMKLFHYTNTGKQKVQQWPSSVKPRRTSSVAFGNKKKEHIQTKVNKKCALRLCRTDSDWSVSFGKLQVKIIRWQVVTLGVIQRKRGLVRA